MSLARCLFCLTLASGPWIVQAAPPPLPYPATPPDAMEIARQVYFVNHSHGVDNLTVGTRKHPMVVVICPAGKKPRMLTLERSLNNRFANPAIKDRDLVIFRSGKLKGTGILVTHYTNPDRSASYAVWLPALRKIRRHSQPAYDDTWGGSDLTYGDMYFRKPGDEHHELLRQEAFPGCLEAITLQKGQGSRHPQQLPVADCAPKGRATYVVKSRTHFPNWWYDYRIQWVDRETFADYRSVYYKNGKVVKQVDKDWQTMGLADPRNQYARYWYARKPATGSETMTFVDPRGVAWNRPVKESLWSEKTLRRIKR